MSDTVLDQEKKYILYACIQRYLYTEIFTKRKKNTGKDGNSNQNKKWILHLNTAKFYLSG